MLGDNWQLSGDSCQLSPDSWQLSPDSCQLSPNTTNLMFFQDFMLKSLKLCQTQQFWGLLKDFGWKHKKQKQNMFPEVVGPWCNGFLCSAQLLQNISLIPFTQHGMYLWQHRTHRSLQRLHTPKKASHKKEQLEQLSLSLSLSLD